MNGGSTVRKGYFYFTKQLLLKKKLKPVGSYDFGVLLQKIFILGSIRMGSYLRTIYHMKLEKNYKFSIE